MRFRQIRLKRKCLTHQLLRTRKIAAKPLLLGLMAQL